MTNIKINRTGNTLVDQVEDKLIEYFKENGLRPGSSIPNEAELCASLGIGRTVLREALSRFKMTGMIQSRTKRGMTLAEPSLLASLKRSVNPLLMSESTLRDIFEMRIALEIGTTGMIFQNITPEYIKELEQIILLEDSLGLNEHVKRHHYYFHKKLYEIAGNTLMYEFQELITPVLEYVIEQNQESFDTLEAELTSKGEFVSHKDLLELLKNNDMFGYITAITQHFKVYYEFANNKKSDIE